MIPPLIFFELIVILIRSDGAFFSGRKLPEWLLKSAELLLRTKELDLQNFKVVRWFDWFI